MIASKAFLHFNRSIATAHRKALETVYYHEKRLIGPTYRHQPIFLTNQFRVGEDNLLLNDKGESAISMEDFAVGLLNEVDNAKFIKK